MSTILLIILALFCPPLAVGLKDGIGYNFWVNLTLSFALIFLSMILSIPFIALLTFGHALWVILQN